MSRLKRRKMQEVVAITSIRNGISGTPFYLGIVNDYVDDGTFLVVRFQGLDNIPGVNDTYVVAAMNLGELFRDLQGGREVLANQHWRGDRFVDVMDKAIKQYERGSFEETS